MSDPTPVVRRVVDAVRQAGVHDATRHLAVLQRHAQKLARPAADRLVGSLVPGQRPHQRRIARLLRSWYTEVYLDALDHALTSDGEPAIGAGDVDRISGAVGRHLGPTARPDSALMITALVWRKARYDAAVAAGEVWRDLDAVAAARGRQLVPAAAIGEDQLRPELLRQWYRRVYLNQAQAELGMLTPLRLVTDAEAAATAQAIADGQPYRLVDTDGVPLMTAHGTVTTEFDRRLDAGAIGVVDPPPREGSIGLRTRATHFWSSGGDLTRRAEIAHAAFDLPPQLVDRLARKEFHQLANVHQLAVMSEYLHRTRATHAEPPAFRAVEVVPGDPAHAAAQMFNLPPLRSPDDPRPRAAALIEQRESIAVDARVPEALALAAAGFAQPPRPSRHRPPATPTSEHRKAQSSDPAPSRRR